jgi:hypothetical protein
MSTIILKSRPKSGAPLCGFVAAVVGASMLASGCGVDPGRPGATADDPFAGLRNRTAVVGYEFGVCDTDEQCVVSACGGATCAPRGEEGVCRDSSVRDCLANVDVELCGCDEGRCRWSRAPAVQMCALLGAEKPMNRPVDGNHPNTYHRPHFQR